MTRTTHRYLSLTAVIVLLLTLGAQAAQAQEVYSRRPAPSQGTAEDRALAPTAPPARTGDEVVLEVGDDFAEVVASHPAGTHFRVAAGVHVGQSLAPRDGDTFTGDAGAIMTGGIDIPSSSFARQGGVWVAGGQTAEPFRHNGSFHGDTEEGFERVAANHDLWIDDTLLVQVSSRGAVDQPGEWFFDYDADEVVVATDPSQARVQLSTPWHAFRSDADDVTIQHLTITRYASYAQHGAIHTQGSGWTVRHVTVSENHGAGILIGPEGLVSDSRIVRNGQIGVTAWTGHGIVVRNNEIAFNRTLPYDWGWEGGGTKFKDTTGAVVTNNWLHHNFGPGVWFDIDNRDAVVTSNLAEDNLIGIMIEISYGATIEDNTIRDNGADGYGDVGAGIWISNSNDAEIAHNDIADNRLDILATHFDRGDGAYGRYETTGLNVHHNTIRITGVKPTGLRVYTGEDDFYSSRGNVFQANSYDLSEAGTTFWWQGDKDWSGWQALGHDTDGSFAAADSAAGVRAPYTPVGYGHSA